MRPHELNIHGTVDNYLRGGCRCAECTDAAMRACPHGTTSGYRYWRCRCPKCREWHNAHQRTAKLRRRANPDRKIKHGTMYAYLADKCRCVECRAAKSEYDRARRARLREEEHEGLA